MISHQAISSPLFQEALAALHQELPEMRLTSDEKEQLSAVLSQSSDKTLEEKVAIIEQIPNAERFIVTYLELKAHKSYSQPIGVGMVLPPGPLMVCPIDPKHYQEYQHSKGESIYCPEHEVALILAD